jgi:hypothetical protein
MIDRYCATATGISGSRTVGGRHEIALHIDFAGRLITDEEPRIMPAPGQPSGSGRRCGAAPNGKQQLQPMPSKIEALRKAPAEAETLPADTGYFSEDMRLPAGGRDRTVPPAE